MERPSWWLIAILILVLIYLLLMLIGVILGLMQRFRRAQESRRDRQSSRHAPGARTLHLPAHIFRSPDPCIYSQRFLLAQTPPQPVTWSNPDIQIQRDGAPVDSHALEPDTVYEVIARFWNRSNYAAVVDMPVEFHYLTFGIGTTSTSIGTTRIDLGANGTVSCPAFARISWRTPPTPGHYCLQVECKWDPDPVPLNNLGQHNTDVKTPSSPATFTFALRNAARETRDIDLRVDTYTLPPPRPCAARGRRPKPVRRLRRGSRASFAARFPVPRGWKVELRPARPTLEPGEEIIVTAVIDAPDDFRGEKAFNVTAFAREALLGGVTLTVRR